MLLGYYWSEISRGKVQDVRILEPVHACLPMMNDVERWMNGPGRDVLLEALSGSEEEAFIPVVKVLGEMREPRAISILINQLNKTTSLSNREQAIRVVHICETLGRLNDRRAVQPMMQLIGRAVELKGDQHDLYDEITCLLMIKISLEASSTRRLFALLGS